MIDPAIDPLETILRQCAATAPEPWYPSAYAHANGIPRDNLDPYLDRLRMGGLIHLTEWVQGRGQGYALTPEGTQVLESPRQLAQLRAGKLNSQPRSLMEPEHATQWERTPWDRGEAVRAALLDPPPAVVTFTLIFLNVLWFLVGMALAVREHVPLNRFAWSSTETVLRDTGAISAEYIVRGQWWRLLSSCFVHIGLLHLGINMYSLYVLGKIQEGMWGKARFLVLYLIAGLGGSCAAVIFSPGHLVAGASGALFGLMSSLAVWIIFNRRYIGPQASFMLRRLLMVFVVNVFISFAIRGISKEAHFGGAAVGLVAAVFLHEHRFGHGLLRRWLAAIGVAALPVLCILAVTKAEAIAALVGSPESLQRWEALDWRERRLPRVRAIDEEVKQLYQEKVEWLEKHKPEPGLRAPEAEQDAIAAFSEARVRLNEAMEILHKAGPYRDQTVEGERSGLLRYFEAEIKRSEEKEIETYYLPRAEAVIRYGLITYRTKTGRLLAQDPRVRDPEDVKATIAALNDEQAKLIEATELLKKAGPYKSEVVEEARQVASQRLEGTAKLLELTSRRLQRGIVWTKEEEKEFDHQKQRVKEINERWKQLVH